MPGTHATGQSAMMRRLGQWELSRSSEDFPRVGEKRHKEGKARDTGIAYFP